MPSFAARLASAAACLSEADPILASLIQRVGPCLLRPDRNRFQMLARSIVSQQISTAAARTIQNRLAELAPGLTPGSLLSLSPEDMRTAGLSRQKANYLLDLAQRVDSGEIMLETIGRCSDEKVIKQLVQVKGVGRWTAQMFLIFSLGRLDVFPYDDLGIRAALRKLYALDDLPARLEAERIATPWRPYATVASWYCWRSLENA